MDVSNTDYAEGRIFNFDKEDAIRTHFLETFPYEGPRQRISYVTDEFAAVCPFSGLPDYGTVSIHYIPQEKVVELKSLKYYLISYRNVGMFQEPITARLYQDLWNLLKPQRLVVKTIYNTRGGIDTTCVISSEDQSGH